MSDEDEEKYTYFGNNLDPLEEGDMTKRKPTPIEDQVATDKQGRRRFHGAFTGGFSAGFYNSVGSSEGWTPSTFQSSRTEKSEKRHQKPQDFMDDEDQEEFGIAPRVLRARQEYGATRPVLTSTSDLSSAVENVLRPVKERVGEKLLKQMGWRHGQGVGPRLTKTDKKIQQKRLHEESQKVYGCARGPVPEAPKDSDSSGEDDENTYAPDDLPPCLVQPKTNTFGMGYSGLDRNPVLSGHVNLFEPQTMNLPTGSKRGIRGQAFGVGAFEAEDEDIYGGDDMSRYDFSLESAAERKHRLQQERLNKAKKAVLGSKDCLEGFKKATGQRLTTKAFPAPVLPKDYKPQHVVKQSKFSTPTVAPSEHTKLGLGRHDMTAEERSILLGEASSKTSKPSTEVPIPSQLTPISISGTQNSASVPSQNSTGTLNVVAAELSEGQFKPFADKEQKQLRYRQFLTLLKDGRKDDLALLQPSSMTEWEKGRELREFEQASKLFKPLSGPISERFVSSATLIGHEEAPTIDTKPKIDADVSAAKMKMFGKLTRTREPWQPHSLVCKRFNVPEPNSGAPVMKKKRPGFSVFDFLSAAPQNTMGENSQNYASTSSKELPAAESGDSVVPQNERLTESAEQDDPLMEQDFPEDPVDKVDLYKAIFLSSSEDEAEPDPQNSSLQTTSKPSTSALPTTVPREKTSRFSDPTLPDPEPQNTKRNLSPARGVFANIDLVIPSTPKPTDPPPSTDLSPDSYGPALPSSVVPSVVPSVPEPVKTLNFPPSNLEWTEKTKKSSSSKKRSSSSSSKKRKHKKEKKSKKSKKNKKESKSSRKRKYSSSSSSSSSSD